MEEQRISGLDSRLAVLESRHDTLHEAVEEMRQDVKKLNNWQRWILGAGTGIGVVIASGYRAISDWFK